jgi:hypothetical protein
MLEALKRRKKINRERGEKKKKIKSTKGCSLMLENLKRRKE